MRPAGHPTQQEGGRSALLPPSQRRLLPALAVGHLHRWNIGRRERLKGQFLVLFVEIDHDRRSRHKLGQQNLLGQWVLEALLDGPPQRSSTQLRVVAGRCQETLGCVGKDQIEALRLRAGCSPVASMRSTISLDLFHGQFVEDDDLVDPVQELGPEVLLQILGDLRPSSFRMSPRPSRR